jgi:hypothetical protein
VDWGAHRGGLRASRLPERAHAPQNERSAAFHQQATEAQHDRQEAYQALWERLQEAETLIRGMSLTRDESLVLARDVNLIAMKAEVYLDPEDRKSINT